jgi:hypothetical protein
MKASPKRIDVYIPLKKRVKNEELSDPGLVKLRKDVKPSPKVNHGIKLLNNPSALNPKKRSVTKELR